MSRLLPYLLPILLTTVFLLTADTQFIWLMPVLRLAIGCMHTYAGSFKDEALTSEFRFFHEHTIAQWFKTVNGLFFMLVNIWAFKYLIDYNRPLWMYVVFLYAMITINSGFAMALAHELMHSRQKHDVLLANVLMLQNGFFYLHTDHLYIHHRYVGTPNDPASARKGEALLPYLRRSFIPRMRMVLGWQGEGFEKGAIAANRLKALLCIVYLAAAAYAGWYVLLWVTIQYVAVILIYETITYIQHYGLVRAAISSTRYEPVALRHSWNCYRKLSNYLHFFMPVHSMHHVLQPDFETARHNAGPIMPRPFGQMLGLAFRPAEWMAVMDAEIENMQGNGRN